MIFKPRKDVVYSVAIWLTIMLAALTLMTPVFFEFTIFNMALLVLGLLTVSWLLSIWFGTAYIIEHQVLVVISHPLSRRINISEIKKITKEKSALATTALALDRIIIHYGSYKQLGVSPQDEAAFVKLLVRENPSIQLDTTLSEVVQS